MTTTRPQLTPSIGLGHVSMQHFCYRRPAGQKFAKLRLGKFLPCHVQPIATATLVYGRQAAFFLQGVDFVRQSVRGRPRQQSAKHVARFFSCDRLWRQIITVPILRPHRGELDVKCHATVYQIPHVRSYVPALLDRARDGFVYGPPHVQKQATNLVPGGGDAYF